jgi:uncharacterized protein (UPF0303 family)
MSGDADRIGRDLERIAEQERRLRFARLDAAAAWDLGCRLKTLAEARGAAALVADVEVGGLQLFRCALGDATPDNAEWVRRKRNTVLRFRRSSYGVGLALARQGTTLEAKTGGASAADHAAHGGGFPLLLEGAGCVGAVTVSGLPQREDHALVVEALAGMLGLPLAGLALEEG